MSDTLIIGIDPGTSSGGWAILQYRDGRCIDACGDKLPTTRYITTTNKTKTELNIGDLYLSLVVFLDRFRDRVNSGSIIFAIEKVHAMPKQGVCSMFSFGDGYGQLKALGRILLYKGVDQFLSIPPQEWKKQLLSGTAKSKGDGTLFVRDHFPQLNLYLGKSKKPHMGIVDAACIAHCAYLKTRT